ncbi:hypothetical protein ACQKH5_14000 [Hyphomonas sp. NPDC076900]|uniref:hypothetical protein n=1 Tax=unclassified Hyphomonas TaxID=2630699 RepID=UPI003CFDD127
MSSFVVAVLLLSTPGLLFGVGKRVISRVNQRQARDIFAALGEIVLFSIPLAFIVLWSIQLTLPDQSRDMMVWARGWDGSLGAILNSGFVTEFAIALTGGAGISLLFGLIYGPLRNWFSWFGFGVRLPLERLLTGFLPPGAYATVITTTTLDGGVIIYRGWVESLQMSPEGSIDFIALSRPEKAFLRGPVVGAPKASQFTDIVEAEAQLRHAPSLLIIESEDIANLLLTKVPGAGKSNWLEACLYVFFWPIRWILKSRKPLFFRK